MLDSCRQGSLPVLQTWVEARDRRVTGFLRSPEPAPRNDRRVMAHKRRTADEVCIEYHLAAAEIRRISAVIKAQVCQRDRDYEEAMKTNPHPGFSKQPCLSEYFALPRIEDEHGNLHMDDGDFEGFCEYCQIAYDAVQERKRARPRLGAAKRAVGAVGKRLCAEASRG